MKSKAEFVMKNGEVVSDGQVVQDETKLRLLFLARWTAVGGMTRSSLDEQIDHMQELRPPL